MLKTKTKKKQKKTETKRKKNPQNSKLQTGFSYFKTKRTEKKVDCDEEISFHTTFCFPPTRAKLNFGFA